MSKTKKILPELRFPEFKDCGEWEYEKGDKLFEPISNKNHNSDLPILAITQEQGAIPRERIDYHVSVTDKSIESYKVVEIGDFIISLRSFQGGIEYSNYLGLCSPAYIILRKKIDVINDFYRHYFKSFSFIKDLNKNLEGIRDGKMISYKQFSEIFIPKPSIEEQQKIAACLSSLDELISAHSQKLELLKTHKKGLMQNMFPQEGEKVPKLRFKEFENDGEWEEKKLGEITEHVKEKVSGKKLMTVSISAGIGFVSQVSKFSRDISGNQYKNYTVLHEGDFSYNKGNSKKFPQGCIYKLKEFKQVAVPNAFISFRFKSNFIGGFYQGYFDNNYHGIQLAQFITSGVRSDGLLNIKTNDFFNIILPTPSIPEQQRIASCLSSLDELITAQSKKNRTTKTA